MDLDRLDAVARSLAAPRSRRTLFGVLAALHAVGRLVGILTPAEADAKERRRRRKQRHKQRKHSGTSKKGCTPKGRGKICAGRCGPVKTRETCGKTVDCGSCDCTPACETCFTCQGAAGAPGTCVPQAAGAPCGEAVCTAGALHLQGTCTGSGACEPADPVPCAPYTQCADTACASSCSGDGDCVAGFFCESGQCVGDLPNGETCANEDQCASGHCVAGICCDTACDTGDVCVSGTCQPCAAHGQCGSNALCVEGVCHACDVTCTAADHICPNGDLQAKLTSGTVYVCPGRYTGSLTLSQGVTLVGAGQGESASDDTILDALASGRVVRVNAGETAALRQVWITNGNLPASGGGVSNEGKLTLTDCTISHNKTNGNGGGVFTLGSSASLDMLRCTLHHNRAGGIIGGGGLLVSAGPATLTDCTIGPANDGYSNGGGLHVYDAAGSKATLNTCTVTGNTGQLGGGIYNSGEVTLNGGSVTGNTASISGDDIDTEATLINNAATIGECSESAGGCGCPGGTVCP